MASGPVVGAFGEMSGDVYAIAQATAEELLATEHCGFYSDKKQGVVAAFILSQIYRSWGLVSHRSWARLSLTADVSSRFPTRPTTEPSAPTPKPYTTRRPPSTTTSALRPATGPGLKVQLMPRQRPALCITAPPAPWGGGGGLELWAWN